MPNANEVRRAVQSHCVKKYQSSLKKYCDELQLLGDSTEHVVDIEIVLAGSERLREETGVAED